MITKFSSFASSFIHLFYPRVCHGCGGDLISVEEYICLKCRQELVPSNYSTNKENRLYNNMVARIPIEEATAFYYFTKGGIVQNLLHELKYKGKTELGIHLGELYGQELQKHDRFKNIDVVIPVPLHDSKKSKRGFNQSEKLSQGICNSTTMKLELNVLTRNHFTETQTNKSRVERWENVKAAFSVNDINKLRGKHVLLVDDVITTGATLEACARKLMEIEGVKISIAALAYTDEL